MNYTIIAFTHNKPGVLNRISDLFLRRKMNIESLTVSETERRGISRFTIVVDADKDLVEKVVKQLYRVVEVYKVFESTNEELIFKELAFFKVSTKGPEQRREVEDVAYLFRAKVNYVAGGFLVVEKAGSEEEINSLFSLLKPFGIKGFVRSGRIALTKEMDPFEGKFGSVMKGVSDTAEAIEVSAIKRIELMTQGEKGAISLAQGIPSFDTPDHIRNAAVKAIQAGLVDRYTPGYGIAPLREAIAEKVKRDNNIDAKPSQIIVTHGAIEGLMAVFMAIMNPEDEILVMTPDYASHVTQTRIVRHGGRPIFVPLKETKDGWILEPERLEGAITQQTKAILICNPCNPTGKVYTEAELKEIARIANKYNLFIITDEIYEYFTFDGKKHISIASMPEVADRTISIMGLSKSYCMTGWRIGYIVAGQKIANQIFKIHDSLVTCPTAVSQYAALEAIKGDKKDYQEFAAGFLKRRQIVIDELSKSDKISLVVPEGAYYAFPKINVDVDDYDLAVRLVKEAGVGVIPGSAFGLGGENHVRISFGGDEIKLREGLKRFVTFVNKL